MVTYPCSFLHAHHVHVQRRFLPEGALASNTRNDLLWLLCWGGPEGGANPSHVVQNFLRELALVLQYHCKLGQSRPCQNPLLTATQ